MLEYGNAPSLLGVFQAFRKGCVCSEELIKMMLLTENKNPKAFFSHFWAVTHKDKLRVMWLPVSRNLGFCVCLQQAKMGFGWWVPAMTPGCTG